MRDKPVEGERYHLIRSMKIEGVLPESAMVTITPKATLIFQEEWMYENERMWRFSWEETKQVLSLKVRFAIPILRKA